MNALTKIYIIALMNTKTTTSKSKDYVGNYTPGRFKIPTTLFELSDCSDYGRHPKITKAPGKFIVFKVLVRKHYGMDFFYEDDQFWYFKR